MFDISYRFLLVLTVILLGFLLKKSNLIKAGDGDALARLALNFTLPALIIYVFRDFTFDLTYIVYPFIGVFIGIIMLFSSFIVYRKYSNREKAMLTMPLLGLNIGLFAIPLVHIIWGDEAVKYLMLIDMGNAFVIFVGSYMTGAIYASEGDQLSIKNIAKKAFRSTPLIVYIITLVLILSGIYYPKPIIHIAEIVSAANSPLALVTLGVFLSFTFSREKLSKMLRFWVTKYSIGLAGGILLFFFFPADDIARKTILMTFILPSSFANIPYAVEFGFDAEFVGTLINSSIVISLILMWILAFI